MRGGYRKLHVEKAINLNSSSHISLGGEENEADDDLKYTGERLEIRTEFLSETPKKRDHLHDLYIRKAIIH